MFHNKRVIRLHPFVLGVAFLLALLPMAALAYDWKQFNGDATHAGNNTQETTINLNNVNGLSRLFQVPLAPDADGAPAYLAQVNTTNGTRDLLFVTQADGTVTALDAHTGAVAWSKQSFTGSCTSTDPSEQPCYTTSSPAIDPNRQYVYNYAHDGKVHKYAVGDGTEVTTGGWPEIISLKPDQEKESSPLTIATVGNISYLYVPSAGYNGDRGDYQGHLTTINLNDGSQKVFNTLCSNQAVHFAKTPNNPDCAKKQSAVWTRSGVVYDPDTNKIYLITGNGAFDPANHHWGDSIIALNPDGSGNSNGDPVDSFTPGDYQRLDQSDLDLGSGGLVILPTTGYPGIKYNHLGAQVGKDSNGLRLFNLDNLSGQGGPGHLDGEIITTSLHFANATLTAPAVWQDANNKTWLFIGNFGGLQAFQLATDGSGNPSLVSKWFVGGNASSPLVANGVLYYANGYGGTQIHALDPTTGTQKWSDNTLGATHWESPVVANGILYISDGPKYAASGNLLPNGHMTAYWLCNTTSVTSNLDDGSCGTLRSALLVASNGPTKTVMIDIPGNVVINLTSGLTVGPGITIQTTSGCSNGADNTLTPAVTLQGSGANSGDGLTLSSGDRITNLWVRGFSGVQIKAPAGSHTIMSCIRASKT